MTPLQKIREGILTNNIPLVAEGYNQLSKEKIDVDSLRENNAQRQASRARANLRNTGIIVDEFSSPIISNENEVEAPKACRAEPFQVKKRINMWADDKSERLVDYSEADKIDDEKNRNAKKAARPKPYIPVEVNCYSCGRRFRVNPAFVIGGSYRCDNCNSR